MCETEGCFSQLVLPQGLYRGETVQDLPHGQGSIVFRSDDPSGRANYTGGWDAGRLAGRGVMRWRNGAR